MGMNTKRAYEERFYPTTEQVRLRGVSGNQNA